MYKGGHLAKMRMKGLKFGMRFDIDGEESEGGKNEAKESGDELSPNN